MDLAPFMKVFLSTVAYTIFGLVVFGVAFWAIVKLSPFSIRKEFEEDHNVAVAILVGAVIIGLAMIISAALHG